MSDSRASQLVKKEIKRQQESLNLIASENYVSRAVREALGSPLANKYSEGYPGKRYYPGNEYCDQIELLAQERALRMFRVRPRTWAVNVQPYSGSPANLAIYGALMKPGETLMGMALASGGHLTHGHSVSLSGKLYNAVRYSVDVKTGLIDYKAVTALAKKHKPKVIVAGFTAYPRKVDFKKFSAIAKSVGAYLVADISHIAGLVAAGQHSSPFPYADVVMTTTHKTLRGPRGAVIFSRIALAEAIDKAVFPGLQGGPHNHVTAAKAVAFQEALQPAFKRYQAQVVKNAQALAKALAGRGVRLITGGTDTHLILADMSSIGLTGMEAEKKLEACSITANRNTIPGDVSPFKPSGLRLGTPALTTRGMKEKEMKKVAELITRCLIDGVNVKKEVAALCRRFPLPH